MSRPDHPARRTCIACRSEEDRDDLVRLVRSPEGELVVDLRGSLPGRGAWVHPARDCLAKVEDEPGTAARAFRGPGSTDGVVELVRAAVLLALGDGLSLASAGGGLVFGHDAVEAAVRDRSIVALLAASDASERTVASVRSDAIPLTTLPLDRDRLGQRVGQGTLAVLGVREVPCTVHLRRQLRRWTRLG